MMRTFARAGGFRYRQSMILDANRCLVLERERRSLDWRQRMRAKEYAPYMTPEFRDFAFFILGLAILGENSLSDV